MTPSGPPTADEVSSAPDAAADPDQGSVSGDDAVAGPARASPDDGPDPRWALLGSLLPLVGFYLIESTYGLTAGIVAGLVLALGEVGWSWWRRGTVPRTTLLFAGLVVVLGGLGLYSDDERFVLYGPVLGDLVFAAMMLAASLRDGRWLLALLAEQQPDLDPHPLQVRFLVGMARRMAVNLALHAALTAWAAGQSREVWLLVSGPVQYGMLGVQVVAEVVWARVVVLRRVEEAEAADL